eukprot:g10393.t1
MGRVTSIVKAVTVAAALAMVASEPLQRERRASPSLNAQPPDLVQPEDQQDHIYTKLARESPHIASGDGLHSATTGVPSSFTIELVQDEGQVKWTPSGTKFVYVWIANENQILIAEVEDRGNGTLTATYESSFPGHYLVHVEEVELVRRDEGRPIAGSPFSLTITGPPTLDVDKLPLCGTDEDEAIEDSFWRPGTWLSSRIASATHGVIRDGWVFQPKTCVYDTFTYDDLMLLASLQEETWIMTIGSSVERGLFLSLVDMALARGQKDNIARSIIEKCWGYANIRVGNLRLTYQDIRLFRIGEVEDDIICNNEKLLSGSSAAYIKSCREFLASTVFEGGTRSPSTILAPSHIQPGDSVNLAITVPMESLPSTWTGKLLMVDHMAGYGNRWRPENPTAATLEKVRMRYRGAHVFGDEELQQMRSYRDEDPRVDFMSVFPMYQAKLFENQETRHGIRQYGGSIHYHYVSEYANSTETKNGQRMVQSTMTEMLANIMIGKAVGSKEELRKRAEATPGILSRSATIGSSFEMEHDCPASLLPFHVKPVPNVTRVTVDSLPEYTQTDIKAEAQPGFAVESVALVGEVSDLTDFWMARAARSYPSAGRPIYLCVEE